jgi:predicted amidophosphoribosyltransferase
LATTYGALPTTSGSTGLCRHCGNHFMDDSNFCRKCGKPRY